MNKIKLENVQSLTPISKFRTLIEIRCVKEDLATKNQTYKTIFINKANEIVARFEGKTHFWVEHLNKDCEALFAVNYFDTKDKNKFDIVKF